MMKENHSEILNQPENYLFFMKKQYSFTVQAIYNGLDVLTYVTANSRQITLKVQFKNNLGSKFISENLPFIKAAGVGLYFIFHGLRLCKKSFSFSPGGLHEIEYYCSYFIYSLNSFLMSIQNDNDLDNLIFSRINLSVENQEMLQPSVPKWTQDKDKISLSIDGIPSELFNSDDSVKIISTFISHATSNHVEITRYDEINSIITMNFRESFKKISILHRFICLLCGVKNSIRYVKMITDSDNSTNIQLPKNANLFLTLPFDFFENRESHPKCIIKLNSSLPLKFNKFHDICIQLNEEVKIYFQHSFGYKVRNDFTKLDFISICQISESLSRKTLIENPFSCANDACRRKQDHCFNCLLCKLLEYSYFSDYGTELACNQNIKNVLEKTVNTRDYFVHLKDYTGNRVDKKMPNIIPEKNCQELYEVYVFWSMVFESVLLKLSDIEKNDCINALKSRYRCLWDNHS